MSSWFSSLFAFGERVTGYDVPVLNERAVRAAAGIGFFFALVAFMNAWLVGNYGPTRVFVLAFLIDFSLRLFVNPKAAPSLILGQWIVRGQQPEWTGAPQKRFAWALGWVLAVVMLYRLVLQPTVGPVNMLICSLCLLLMFFETAFGICIGCKVYNLLTPARAQHCPGGVCEAPPVRGAGGHWAQGVLLLAFSALVFAWAQHIDAEGLSEPLHPPRAEHAEHTEHVERAAAPASSPQDAAEAERCKVPEFAKAIGHEEKWKLHNNCR